MDVRVAAQSTENRITVSHISFITYRNSTNLFSFSCFSGQLDIILLAHTLGTCDFFQPPLQLLFLSLMLLCYPWDRNVERERGRERKREREREKRLTFLFNSTPGIRYRRCSMMCSIVQRIAWKTPATLASALVVSTPETTRGLYTLPSRSHQLSPKTISASPMRLLA